MTSGRLAINYIMKRGILAGAAGGLAEIAWVSLYAIATGGDAAILARGITTAAGMTAVLSAASVTTGIVLHMILAMTLGVALAVLWQGLAHTYGASSRYAVVLASLSAVWAINFFVVLPVISPAFVHLVPYSVSLVSKLLFGLAAAETLRRWAVVDQETLSAVFLVAKKQRPNT